MSLTTSRPTHALGGLRRLRLVTVLVALAAVVSGMLTSQRAQAATFTGANLALNKYASASSGTNPGAATDGSTSTSWSPSGSGWQTWSVDFGSSTTIAGVRLNFAGTPPTSYKIQTSSDASNWTAVYTTTSGSGTSQDVVFSSPVTTRHLQVYFTQDTGYKLTEFEAYGDVSTSTPPSTGTNLALNKYASASSGTNPGAATDGSTSTSWSPSGSGWQTWSVDFGSSTTVSSVTLRFGGTAPTSYKIQASSDANNWTAVYTTTSGSGADQTVTFSSPVTSRHLQVYFTQDTGYKLTEFEAYNGDTTTPPPSGGQETVGGGTIANPAVGPAASYGLGSGFTLVKNWNFGSNGTIANINDMNSNFQYSIDHWNTWDLGGQYGSETLAPDSAHALPGQPVQDPNNPVRSFTSDSIKTSLVPLNGATTVRAQDHNVGNGSFYPQWELPRGGSRLGQDILWETKVRYDTPEQFLFALWNAGDTWDGGAEIDLVESFGWKHDDGSQNYDGRYWHSDVIGGTSSVNYSNWQAGMASVGIKSFDPKQYHTWSLLYRKNDTYSLYVDGIQIQSGSMNWTVGGSSSGKAIDFQFLFDNGWGSTVIGADSHMNDPMAASKLAGKYYEYDYSRVYLRN